DIIVSPVYHHRRSIKVEEGCNGPKSGAAIEIVGINPGNDLIICIGDAFVYAMVVTPVRFRHVADQIWISCRKIGDNLLRPVRGAAVSDKDFHTRIALVQDALEGGTNVLPLVEGGHDHGKRRHLFDRQCPYLGKIRFAGSECETALQFIHVEDSYD